MRYLLHADADQHQQAGTLEPRRDHVDCIAATGSIGHLGQVVKDACRPLVLVKEARLRGHAMQAGALVEGEDTTITGAVATITGLVWHTAQLPAYLDSS